MMPEHYLTLNETNWMAKFEISAIQGIMLFTELRYISISVISFHQYSKGYTLTKSGHS